MLTSLEGLVNTKGIPKVFLSKFILIELDYCIERLNWLFLVYLQY